VIKYGLRAHLLFITIKKLKPRKLGPNKIIKKNLSVSYKFELPKNIKIYPVIHVSEFKQCFEDHFRRKQKPYPPIIVNDEEKYEVEKILDKRKHDILLNRKNIHYLKHLKRLKQFLTSLNL